MGELLGCVSDAGYIAASTEQASAIITQATVNAAIQTAVALYQRNASGSISNIQTDLANQQVTLAEEVHAHAIEFWPAETTLINDIFSEPKVAADYVILSSQFDVLSADALASGRQVWIDTMRSMCMGPTPCDVTRWQRNANAARVDIESYACRQDENRAQILNDRRFSRQVGVLRMGHGAVADLVSYEQMSEFSSLSAANVLEGGINAATATYGFYAAQRVESTGWGAGIQNFWQASRSSDIKGSTIAVPNATRPPPLPPFAPELAGAPQS